ncbi:MAG: YicC/YloC family endoribonuclease, partial [Methylococcales bacterium]|nr:YicC/YloC family endoribonuclease [Methylococcales bacterium]
MIKSMTAYACNEAEISNLTINCELRSVNHRYSDVSLKLPDNLRFMETELRALLSSQIKRGKIECIINYKKQAKNGQGFVINHDALTNLLDATEQVEVHIMSTQPFSALDVLAFPGILQEPSTDKNELHEGVTHLVKQTLAHLLVARAREGAQLKTLIEERCAKINTFVAAASERTPVAIQITRDKLKNKITELVAQPDFDRLEQELVFLAQKLDVTEELDRLATHIKEVMRVLHEEEPAGKRLDFLMQELNREANTLGSKSVDSQLSHIAIELKVLIEQMREQI